MQRKVGMVASEPLGALAALSMVISWALHSYVPDMPPEIITAVAIVVVGFARPFVMPVKRHVVLVDEAVQVVKKKVSDDA